MAVDLSLLGPYHVTCDGRPVEFPTEACRGLLAFLAIEADRAHQRAALAALLWPDSDESAALANLRQTLARIRRAFPEPFATGIVRATATTLQFGLDPMSVDLHRARRLLADIAMHNHAAAHACSLCAARRQEAIALYRGDLLQGFDFDQSLPFHDWVRIWQTRLRADTLDALSGQIEHLRRSGEYGLMRDLAARQIELDPWSERGHRDLMLALALAGDRAAAVAQFQRCERTLRDELGITPDAETTDLHQRILRSSVTELAAHVAHESEAMGTAIRSLGISIAPAPGESPLLGRDATIADVLAAFRDQHRRVITLVGPGGVGKTRLALAVLAAIDRGWRHDVGAVSLASIHDHEQVPFLIADALSISGLGPGSLASRIATAVGDREIALLIDNVEQVIEAAPLLASLVELCPSLLLLVTSRRPLNVQGETIVRVEPLGHAFGGGDASVRLLMHRARQAGASLPADKANRDALVTICNRLEGLPLAIELAAARLAVLTPSELLTRLDRQLPLLTDGPRSAPQRQRTMRSTIAWGYDLLDDATQRTFRRLAVFPDGFTFETVERVCTPGAQSNTDHHDVHLLDHIVTLRDASLITSAGNDGSSRRFRLMEPVREFAEELLGREGELESAWLAHADALIARFDGRHIAPYAPDDVARDLWLEGEFQNLRAVLSRLDELGEARRYATLAGLVGWYWFVRGRLPEGLTVLERAASRADGLPPDLVANINVVLAKIRLSVGQVPAALDLLERLLVSAEATGDAVTAAQVLIARGVEATTRSDPAAAGAWFDTALARTESIEPNDLRIATASVVRSLRGVIAREAGQLDVARDLFLRAIEGHRLAGSARGEMFGWVNLGDVERHEGEFAPALSSYGNALELAMQFTDYRVMGLATSAIGQVVAEAYGDQETGDLLAQSAWKQMQEHGLLSRVPHQHLDRPDPAAVTSQAPISILPFAEIVRLALEIAQREGRETQLAPATSGKA